MRGKCIKKKRAQEEQEQENKRKMREGSTIIRATNFTNNAITTIFLNAITMHNHT